MIRPCRHPICFVLISLVPSVLYLSSYATAAGPPTVLTFDDVSADTVTPVPIPPGYGGVNWAADMSIYGPSQPPYDPESSPNRILFGGTRFSYEESQVTFIGGPKIFDGAYFSGYELIWFRLYVGGSLIAQSPVLNLGGFDSGGSGPTFLPSGYPGPVDQVGIQGYRGFFVMDNFTFHEVPEPSSVFLCLATIFATLMRRRNFR